MKCLGLTTVLWIAVVWFNAALVAPWAQSAQAGKAAVIEIKSPEDVETAVAARKNQPGDVPALVAAWKAIVADSLKPNLAPITAKKSSPPIKIIVDTDLGTDIDDAIALTFVLRHPDFEVCAITTSRGEVRKRADLVSRLLKIHGRTETPFAPGSPVLFNGKTIKDKPVFQHPFAGPESDRPAPAANEAQELFRRVIEANPGQVWLVILGPMTNAAILLRDHPELAKKLKGMICMGGEPTRRHKETNIANDVEAAKVVFASGHLKFAATQDICIRLLIPKQDLDRLAQAGTPTTAALVELIGYWQKANPGKPGPLGVDVNAVMWLASPELFTTKRMGLNVEGGGVTTPAADAPPLAVTANVDPVAARRLLMSVLLR